MTTTTADPPTCVVLSLIRDGDLYVVEDCVGKRYGAGETPRDAFNEWCFQVSDLLSFDEPTAPPLTHEIARYRSALAGTA